MPSPFPGMNPYLEQNDAWEDFHGRYMVALADRLDTLVGPNYFVKIEVRLYLHELSGEERRFFAQTDVGIARSPTGTENGGIAARIETAPVQLTMPALHTQRLSSVEIRDRRNRRVVTAIELLSPSNKTPGADRYDYLQKRGRLLMTSANLVEIDLRRGGERPEPPALPPCDYYVLVSRARDWPKLGMWPLALRDPLPVVPVPLQEPDPDVALDLQAVLHRVYDAAGYAKYIYSDTPEPPLRPEDAEWARPFLRTTGE